MNYLEPRTGELISLRGAYYIFQGVTRSLSCLLLPALTGALGAAGRPSKNSLVRCRWQDIRWPVFLEGKFHFEAAVLNYSLSFLLSSQGYRAFPRPVPRCSQVLKSLSILFLSPPRIYSFIYFS